MEVNGAPDLLYESEKMMREFSFFWVSYSYKTSFSLQQCQAFTGLNTKEMDEDTSE